MLQYVPAQTAAELIERAAACIEPGSRLVIRSGLDGGGTRARFTRAVDVFARGIGWMNAAPQHYPSQSGLGALLKRCGLRARFSRLSGWLPFNNWLIVGERG